MGLHGGKQALHSTGAGGGGAGAAQPWGEGGVGAPPHALGCLHVTVYVAVQPTRCSLSTAIAGSGGWLVGTVLSQTMRYVVHLPPPIAWYSVILTVLSVPLAADAVVTATGLAPPSEPSPSQTGVLSFKAIATGAVVGPATHQSDSATLAQGLVTK